MGMLMVGDRYTVFRSQAEADRIAKICADGDPHCEYRAEKIRGGWMVVVYDEGGCRLGAL